ncbi:MAG TPA: methyltransferase domain-containing protein [Mycobacterium sp.]|nr:methyltransferase domain-containing protein [Mycobacterium sp.]
MQPHTDLYLDRARADSFGAAARLYDARRPRYPSQLIDDLLMQDARTVLDVGAGTGIASEQLLAKGVNVLAVEPDPRMADIARDKGIPVEFGTFESWEPAQRRFDLVVFGQSFHWVNPDIALPKVHRLLPAGGRLALMWNRLYPIRPTRSDLAEIYRDYLDPGSPPVDGSWNGPLDTEHRADGLIAPITAAGFTAEERTYPRDGHCSTEQWLDLAFTYSNHLVLAAEKASELRTRLAERIGSNGVSVGGDTLLILATRA